MKEPKPAMDLLSEKMNSSGIPTHIMSVLESRPILKRSAPLADCEDMWCSNWQNAAVLDGVVRHRLGDDAVLALGHLDRD